MRRVMFSSWLSPVRHSLFPSSFTHSPKAVPYGSVACNMLKAGDWAYHVPRALQLIRLGADSRPGGILSKEHQACRDTLQPNFDYLKLKEGTAFLSIPIWLSGR